MEKNDDDIVFSELPFGEGIKEPRGDCLQALDPEGARSCSEADWPISEGASGSTEGDGGFSNTPRSSPKINTCIDYLKFRFDVGYEDNPGFFYKLFAALEIDVNEAGREGIYNNYLHHLVLGTGATLAYGGTMTLNSKGMATTLFEMKGQACRRFEERRWILDPNAKEKGWDKAISGYWLELLETLKGDMEGTCTRVDLPTDSLDGFITADDIREKIKNREYTTTMRRLEITDDGEAPEFEIPNGQKKSLMGVATIRDSKLSGYTATFGTRKTTQLCIYDKAAEQELKAGGSPYDSWMRFEVRYYHEAADQEMAPLISALRNGTIESHILKCLATAIDFKEPNSKDSKHRNEARRWSKWDEFLNGTEKGKAFATIRGSFSVESNMSWLVKEAAKSLTRVAMAYEIHPDIIARLLVERASMNLSPADYLAINEFREKTGKKKVYNCGELLYYCMDPSIGAIYCPPELEKYFLGRKEK